MADMENKRIPTQIIQYILKLRKKHGNYNVKGDLIVRI
jgi:hypothetical protein